MLYFILLFIIVISILNLKLKIIFRENYTNFDRVNPLKYFKYELPIINKLKLGTANKNTTCYQLGRILSKYFPLQVIETSGTLENIDKLSSGEIDLAIGQEEIFSDAYFGKNDYLNTPKKNFSFVGGLFFEYFTIILNNLIPVRTFTDLGRGFEKIDRNYIIGIPEKTSGTYYIIKKIFEIYGIDAIELNTRVDNSLNKIYYVTADINSIISLFIRGDIDGLCMITGPKNPYIINLCKFKAVKFLGIEYDETKSNIMKSFLSPIYYKDFDPRVFFTTNYMGNKIITIGSRSILVSRKEVNNQYINTLLTILYNNIDSIRDELDNYLFTKYRNNKLVDSLIPENIPFVSKDLAIHPGALEIFRKNGYITNDTNNCYNNECHIDYKKLYWKYPIDQVTLK